MRRKKALYIGHLYHQKTQSTKFLKSLLEENYDMDYSAFDPYTGDYQESFGICETDYDYLICFQIMPDRIYLDKKYSYRKGILFPMYDATIDLKDDLWAEYKDFLIISFSKALCCKLQGLGIEYKYIQYFPKPHECFAEGKKDAVFFWQRRENINLNTLAQVLGDSEISQVRLHVAMDPEQSFKEYKNSLNAKVIKSEWFEKKEEMQERIEGCSLYMASRRYEGIGMGFLEAMGMGRCVIAPDEGTMNEYIQDGVNGYLYDFDAPKPIKTDHIREIQKNAYQTIKQGYERWCIESKNIIKWIDQSIQTPKVTVFTYVERVSSRINKVAIRQCMESVHRQTYNNVSHMVILESDDQELMGILAPYIKMGWIQVFIGTGKGKYGEYGAAIWKTDGFYAIFLDCNSCFTDIRSIDEYVSYIQQQNCDYCYSDCQIWNVYGCETGTLIPVQEALFAYSAYNYQAAIYKIHVIKHENALSGNYLRAGDFELECTLFFGGYKAAYLPHAYVAVRSIVSEEDNFKRKEELAQIYSNLYGLEWDKFYLQLTKLSYNRMLSKDMYRHICNCIKGHATDRTLFALTEVNGEYKVIGPRIVCPEYFEEQEPLVTVVTVTYNVITMGREKTFRQCIESIHEQTYSRIEHLVIDGNSNDGTLEIIQEYADKGWLRYISEPDQGVWDAMRKGMQEAKGKYINFLNTDDLFARKESVALAVGELQKQNADYFFSLTNRIEKDGDAESAKPLLDYYGNEETVWWGKGMCHQSMYVKTDVMKEMDTFNADIDISFDNYLMLQLVFNKKKAAYLEMPLVTFRMGGISAAEDVQDTFAAYFYECCGKKFGMTLGECRSIWLLKCLEEKDLQYNLRLLQKIDRREWRDYFAEQLIKLIPGAQTSSLDNGLEESRMAFDKLSEQYRRLEKRSNKFVDYFKVLNLWMKKKKEHISVHGYLAGLGIRRIAVYGVGELGERLYEELENSDIEIAYGIDNNTSRNYHQLPVRSLTQDLEEVQVIIVTPVADYEDIRSRIKQVTDCTVISLKDIIQNM